MKRKNLFSLLLFSPLLIYFTTCFGDNNLSLYLSTEKGSYYEEEEIILSLVIENVSDEDKQIEIQYLQPVENTFIFTGGTFLLTVRFNDDLVDRFTNHMPPEPKPGILPVLIKKGQKISWKVPFPYYYYPLSLPGEFRIKLQYQQYVSNEVAFDVKKSEGKKSNEAVIVNPDFSQGKDYIYGWKLHDKKTIWDREKHLLVFNLNKKTAEGEGLWVYSLFHKIEAPAELNISVRLKSNGPKVIIFVEGWGLVNGRKRRIERNECFVTSENEWQEDTFDVVFKKPEVRWVRIKLYSYLKAGTVYFESINLNKK
jgi:hypothetical protein